MAQSCNCSARCGSWSPRCPGGSTEISRPAPPGSRIQAHTTPAPRPECASARISGRACPVASMSRRSGATASHRIAACLALNGRGSPSGAGRFPPATVAASPMRKWSGSQGRCLLRVLGAGPPPADLTKIGASRARRFVSWRFDLEHGSLANLGQPPRHLQAHILTDTVVNRDTAEGLRCRTLINLASPRASLQAHILTDTVVNRDTAEGLRCRSATAFSQHPGGLKPVVFAFNHGRLAYSAAIAAVRVSAGAALW